MAFEFRGEMDVICTLTIEIYDHDSKNKKFWEELIEYVP
jgi:hypothetical protein